MPKFVVKVAVTKEEFWRVEAPNQEEAAENYHDGQLFDTTDEECQIAGVFPR